MKINVYQHKPDCLSRAIIQVAGLFEEVSGEGASETADVVLVQDRQDINSIYNHHQLFGLIITDRHASTGNLPENVFAITPELVNKATGLIAFIDWVKRAMELKSQSSQPVKAHQGANIDGIPEFRNKYRVLVLDDKHENLDLAQVLLERNCGHHCSVARYFGAAMMSIKSGEFDAILTDMQMPVDRHYSSMSPDAINPAQEVPYGFAMIFEATLCGLPVAVVTDGNHHQDWVSAMFDHIHEATVNGQKVLFINSIGKRWDKALKALMEPMSK